MSHSTFLPFAVRAYAIPLEGLTPPKDQAARRRWPAGVLIVDCETTVDPAQRLRVASYQYCRWTTTHHLKCFEEGVILGDDLAIREPDAPAVVAAYVARHADTSPHPFVAHTRRSFVDDRLWPAIQGGCLLVGFNLPFDLTRLAVDVGWARGDYRGGVSLTLWDRVDPDTGEYVEHPRRPRIVLKALDSTGTFMGFTSAFTPKGVVKERIRARMLDLRTAAYALTGTHGTLEETCALFEIPLQKVPHVIHGAPIDDHYLDYVRGDVGLTLRLLEQVRAEFQRHRIPLIPEHAFSSASLARGYWRAMHVRSPGHAFRDVSSTARGQSLTAYFGGRCGVLIRKTVVPVLYCDFLSMYPTCNILMGLWPLATAQTLTVEDATEDVRALLASVTPARVFDPTFWRGLRGFVCVQPDDDILPVRAQYDPVQPIFGIGVSRVSADGGLWYALPDVVASTLLRGKAPRVLIAWRLVPHGTASGLRAVRLRHTIPIDPRRQDFFQAVIEARKGLPSRTDLSADERARLDRFLKLLANAGSYGVFAEMHREDRATQDTWVRVYGLEPFECPTPYPEALGDYCFPPFAALITSGARLMLALLERRVLDARGTYAFCDTDSMAPVVTATGGRWPCPHGPERLEDGRAAIRTLSMATMLAIVAEFTALNPYDRAIVPGSILKIEDENFRDGVLHPLYCDAISAKRYALFHLAEDGTPILRKVSEHGLGHLLNPTDPESLDRDWITQVWAFLVARALGRATPPPAWFDRPAVSRITVSSPDWLRTFAAMNAGKLYADQIKPWNFVLSVQVAPLGHPVGVDPARFQLIAPYTRDAEQWLGMSWIDKYSGTSYAITTGARTVPDRARVVTYGDVVAAYAVHPEAKSADQTGAPCGRDTIGLLQRRQVQLRLADLIYQGKESNQLEAVEQGLVHDPEEVRALYPNPLSGFWSGAVLPLLRTLPSRILAARAAVSERTIKAIRNRRSDSTPAIRGRLVTIARDRARAVLRRKHLDAELRAAAERLIALHKEALTALGTQRPPRLVRPTKRRPRPPTAA